MDKETLAAARCFYFMQGYLSQKADHGSIEFKQAYIDMENYFKKVMEEMK